MTPSLDLAKAALRDIESLARQRHGEDLTDAVDAMWRIAGETLSTLSALEAEGADGWRPDDDSWRKPPPHFKPDERWQRQPQINEEWDANLDEGVGEYRSKRRLAFAGDLADPRAPPGMALVSRLDVSRVLGRLAWLEARFENTHDSALPPSPALVDEKGER